MHRFFINKKNIKDNSVIIDGEDVKHIKNVLRLKEGEEVVVCDGESSDYLITIETINKNEVIGTIKEAYPSKGEPPLDIILYQGLPKSSKMDLIIQKAVEIGIKEIIPIITERSVVKIEDNKKEQKKLERWNRISLEASKQCKRGIVPKVNNVINFKELINRISDNGVTIVPYENEGKRGLKDLLKNINSKVINIVIGPEGGFEESEIDDLIKSKANIVSLGPRILRTETAGFTTLAIILYEVGDLGVV